MIENLEEAFTLESGGTARTFWGIRKMGFSDTGSFGSFGSFVIDAYTTPRPKPRGTYFTTIPISSVEYRKTHKTGAAYRRGSDHLIIYSDHGVGFLIHTPCKALLNVLEQECAARLPRARGI